MNTETQNLKEPKMKAYLTVLPHEVDALIRENDGDAYRATVNKLETPMLAAALISKNCNQTAAANCLGLNRGTFRKKIIKHGLIGKTKRELIDILMAP